MWIGDLVANTQLGYLHQVSDPYKLLYDSSENMAFSTWRFLKINNHRNVTP